MTYLAKRYKGTLHTPYLGNGSIESTFNAICASAVASHHGSSKTRNEPLGASVDERSCQQGTEPLVLRLRSGSTDDGAKQLIGSNIRGESSILGGADIVKNQHEAAASNPALLKTEEENDIAFISSVVTNSSANKTLNPKMNLDDSNISGNRKRTSVVNNHDTTLTTSQDQNRDGNNNNLTARNKRVKLDINDPEQALDTNKTDETHVIFAIDFSGSMRAKDVKTKEGRATRWEAVFECIDTFLTQQLQQQENNKEESTCFVSMLIFNEEAQTLINRVSLQKQSRDVRNVFKQAQCSHRPNGGTGFAAGFKLAYELSAADIDSNVVLVFLSDGRPGDLIPKPPSNPRIAMQTSFRHKKQDHSAAGQYIEKMQERHSNFNLQLICLFEDGKPVSSFELLISFV